MQLSEIKNIFHKELSALYPKEEIDSFFYQCIGHFLKLERFVLVMQPNLVITKEEEQPLFETLSRLKLEEPIQYIFGEAHFMDLVLKVNQYTLIPRPETEELVQWIIDDCKKKQEKNLKILDIGTGSGCIAIALAKQLPNAQIYALDVSSNAIKVAQQNADENKARVSFIRGDILDSSLDLNFNFDIVVSNPPYVREQEKNEIHNNVKKYEPSIALFVDDDDALIFYSAIAGFCENHLNTKGRLYLEINQYLSFETKALFENHNFTLVALKKDIFGNDRMLKCYKNE